MIRALYTATSGMLVESRRLDLAARNLYYGQVPGYKGAGELRAALPATGGDLPLDVQTDYAGEFVNPAPGPVRPTNRPLDLALSGEGLFVLQGPNGLVYTRDGRFYRGPDGTVRNGSGYPLLGENGPVVVPPNADVRVDQEGRIWAGGKQVDRLRLEAFPGYRGLLRVGGNLFVPTGAVKAVAAEAQVIQGALEESNVQQVQQMTRMIESVRAFEAYQKVVQTVMEDVTGEAVRRIGRVA
ncbi:MAG: flagellar hook-basal body protein [Deltaproteobacteria bacterium]|nr:flagellar hook-basal body protein [Deltaproteobacteria bacterium]